MSVSRNIALEMDSGPSVEPISTADMKLHLRIESAVTADDNLIDAMIQAVREKVEHYLNRKLITQTWALWLDGIPRYARNEPIWEGVVEAHINILDKGANYIEIPIGPVQSVSSVKYYTTDNSENDFSSANYYVDTALQTPRVVLNYGQTWPTGLRHQKNIEVTFIAGYGDAGSDVPESIILAMKQWVAYLYEHRGDEETSDVVPIAIRMLLDPYRIVRLL
jgi:hypothetical protein